MTWGKGVFIAVDQLVNALAGGWPDETLSSRCWRWHRDNKRHWPRRIVDALLFWDRDHCRASYQSERDRLQHPPELRGQGENHAA